MSTSGSSGYQAYNPQAGSQPVGSAVYGGQAPAAGMYGNQSAGYPGGGGPYMWGGGMNGLPSWLNTPGSGVTSPGMTMPVSATPAAPTATPSAQPPMMPQIADNGPNPFQSGAGQTTGGYPSWMMNQNYGAGQGVAGGDKANWQASTLGDRQNYYNGLIGDRQKADFLGQNYDVNGAVQAQMGNNYAPWINRATFAPTS